MPGAAGALKDRRSGGLGEQGFSPHAAVDLRNRSRALLRTLVGEAHAPSQPRPGQFGDMVKAVVDLHRRVMAIDKPLIA